MFDAGFVSRRGFLVASGAVGLTALSAGPRTAKASTTLDARVRKDVRDLSPDEVDKYREAFRRIRRAGPRPNPLPDVQGMQAMNKTGEAYQALIHTNHCPHHNWWFLPWHRAYLFYFEEVLRTAVADYKPQVPLAIPYWNWTEQQEIPEAFREGPDSNPLGHQERFFQGLDDSFVGPRVIRSTVDRATTFESFGSRRAARKQQSTGGSPFESGPHDVVHGQVGGGGDMSTTSTAAFDPIFWSHHANIDRLWSYWLTIPGRRNPADRPWGDLPLTEFVDAAGQPVNRTVREVMSDASIQGILYQPHRRRATILAERAAEGTGGEIQALSQNDAPLHLELNRAATLTVPATVAVGDRMRAAGGEEDKPVLFHVQGLQLPKGNPAVFVRVFVNKPDAGPDTPTDDRHYAGFFGFFADSGHGDEPGGGHGGEGVEGTGRLVNLTQALTQLAVAGEYRPGDEFKVSLVLLPLPRRGGERAALGDVAVPFKGASLLLQE